MAKSKLRSYVLVIEFLKVFLLDQNLWCMLLLLRYFTVLSFIYLTFRAFHVFNRSYVSSYVRISFLHCGYKYFVIAEIFLIKTNPILLHYSAFYSFAFDTLN